MFHSFRLIALMLATVLCAVGAPLTLTYSGTGTGSSSIIVPAWGGTWVTDNYRISDITVTLSNLSITHAGSVEIVLAQLEFEGLFNTALDTAVLFDGTEDWTNNHKFVASQVYTFADGGEDFNTSWTLIPRTYPSGEYSPEDPLSGFYNNTTQGYWAIAIWNRFPYLSMPIAGGWNWTLTINAIQDPVGGGEVPEPASVALTGLGLVVAGFAGHRARQRRQSAA